MASPQARLTAGSVGRHLVAMTVPVLFGILTMMQQTFIDMWFIGRVGDLYNKHIYEPTKKEAKS